MRFCKNCNRENFSIGSNGLCPRCDKTVGQTERERKADAFQAWWERDRGAGHAGAERQVRGIEEPFCACGRRWSDCDGSRAKCHKRQQAAGCEESTVDTMERQRQDFLAWEREMRNYTKPRDVDMD